MDLTDQLAAHLLRIGGEYHDAADPDRPDAATGKQAEVFTRLSDACETAVVCGLAVDADKLVRGVLDATTPAAGGTGSPSERLTQWWATKDDPVPAADAPQPVDEAVAQAKANANRITAPDGSRLLDDNGGPVKTVRAATILYVDAEVDYAVWTHLHETQQVDPGQAGRAFAKFLSLSERMLTALAHHAGASPDEMRAQLKSKVDKKVREAFKESGKRP